MNILIIGSGGREHALVWKIKQSPLVNRLYCAPGNAGISEWAEIVPIPSSDIEGLLSFALEKNIQLTVVGPEQPLTEGIVDAFQARGLDIFGPSKSAAALEGSKVFAKEFMKRNSIPTAEFRTFTRAQVFDAERYVNEVPVPIVVKADGLAAGKGVMVCESKEHAVESIRMMMNNRVFGDAGANIVVEEFLEGEEATVLAITDGRHVVTLAAAQDHKRILDHDRGKNTGGMGAYAPAPSITSAVLEHIKETIILPTLRGMAAEGNLYKGCLYIGLMITQTGPKVVEFNCRFGDPETQVVLPLLESDLVPLMMATIRGNLSEENVHLYDRTAVCVVIASSGYPDVYETGKAIVGLENASHAKDVVVFHAGTKWNKNTLVTSGGRVLGVMALGPKNDLSPAIEKAYSVVQKITFDGAYYRSDIGKKGIQRMKELHDLEMT